MLSDSLSQHFSFSQIDICTNTNNISMACFNILKVTKNYIREQRQQQNPHKFGVK